VLQIHRFDHRGRIVASELLVDGNCERATAGAAPIASGREVVL
jgi:hypothetical protein